MENGEILFCLQVGIPAASPMGSGLGGQNLEMQGGRSKGDYL